MVEKYTKNGKTAVLVSHGFGAGWSTWGNPDAALDKDIVQAVLDNNYESCLSA